MNTATTLLLFLHSAEAVQLLRGIRQGDRRLVSRSSTFCYDDAYYAGLGQTAPQGPLNCFRNMPSMAPDCDLTTAGSSSACKCTNEGCDLEATSFGNDYTAAYCSSKTSYIQGFGDEQTLTAFCDQYVVLEEWESRTRPSGEDEQVTTSWWWPCWARWGYSWKDGACRSKKRFLGELCWDGGECQNEGVQSYGDYRLSCANWRGKTQCVPSFLDIKRNECDCNLFDWNFFVACGSSSCNGHACVLSTGDGKKYCDFNTNNNW